MDGWNTSFLLGRPIFRGYVSFREGSPFCFFVFLCLESNDIQTDFSSGFCASWVWRLPLWVWSVMILDLESKTFRNSRWFLYRVYLCLFYILFKETGDHYNPRYKFRWIYRYSQVIGIFVDMNRIFIWFTSNIEAIIKNTESKSKKTWAKHINIFQCI